MKKNRIFSLILAMLLVLSAAGLSVFAEEGDVTVKVTIANGSAVVVQEPITVTDVDEDGALTVNDALILVHEKKYPEGRAGYATSMSEYGMGVSTLWGVTNGGSYGYYVNNVACWSPLDVLSNGDYLYAFVYTDTKNYSDAYSYFDKNEFTAYTGEAVELTLSMAGYDTEWNPVVLPVANATILVDGADSGLKTDAEGKVTLTFDAEKTYLISATSDAQILVPPICIAQIAQAPVTGDAGVFGYAVLLMAAAGALVLIGFKRLHA